MLGNFLLSIVSICTMISYLPQIFELIKSKSSNDISIKSWILWVISSFSYMLYAFMCSDDFMLRVVAILEFLLCLLILLLVVRYKRDK